MWTIGSSAKTSRAASTTSPEATSLQQTSCYPDTECVFPQNSLQIRPKRAKRKSIIQIAPRTMASSTSATSTSSFSRASSSSSSLPAVAIDGEPRSNGTILRKNEHYEQTRVTTISRGRRRRATTNAMIRSSFSSPDRYATGRQRLQHDTSPIRTISSHNNLRGRERYERQRDTTVDPFRPVRSNRAQNISTIPLGLQSQYIRAPHYIPSFVHGETAGLEYVSSQPSDILHRRVSLRTVWSVGGRSIILPPGQLHGIDVGAGELIASGSNAPMWNTNFIDTPTVKDKKRIFERRVALALGIDQARRVLPVVDTVQVCALDNLLTYKPITWQDGSWKTRSGQSFGRPHLVPTTSEKTVPNVAFRVLDAPRLKDDFYCSVLAYSKTCRTLAVALTHRVYLWTEKYGVRYPPLSPVRPISYVMSLAFSSEEGGKAILAVGRSSGQVTLWSLLEQNARMEITHPVATCCLSFRPTLTLRYSQSQGNAIECEDLLVSDDSGHIHYYSIEWSRAEPASATLLMKLEAHSQNICGLSWSPDGRYFASGGNDNSAALFSVNEVLPDSSSISATSNPPHDYLARMTNNDVKNLPQTVSTNLFGNYPMRSRPISYSIDDMLDMDSAFRQTNPRLSRSREDRNSITGAPTTPPRSPPGTLQRISNHLVNPDILGTPNAHKHIFRHSAAVKAIAFAPWQPTLLATGGGSNDKQIHFHHTISGSTLAVINVFAQVTSLVWSTTRREIAATFGYAQPEHEIRIAVFAWPSCQCVVSIPWERKSNGEIGRALWAIPYPGGPNDATPEAGHSTNNDSSTWNPVRRRTTTAFRHGLPTPETSPDRRRPDTLERSTSPSRAANHSLRTEGETWASRTEEEGSMIIACCDQTVKFFEVWAGKSKGKSRGLGSKIGVLGGSKVLEGWCEGVGVEEVSQGMEVIR